MECDRLYYPLHDIRGQNKGKETEKKKKEQFSLINGSFQNVPTLPILNHFFIVLFTKKKWNKIAHF